MAKILVVDDDARNLRLAVAALDQAGHEVLSAEGFSGYFDNPRAQRRPRAARTRAHRDAAR